MSIDTELFRLSLSQLFNTTTLVTSLAVYSSQKNKLLLLFGVVIGYMINIILCSTITTQFSSFMVNTVLSTLVLLLATIVGYNMTKSKNGTVYRLSLILLPACFITSQGIELVMYFMQQPKQLTSIYILRALSSSTLLCGVYGTTLYYSLVTFFTPATQKCMYSFVIYFTGAVYASRVVELLNIAIHPPTIVKNIVQIIHESQQAASSSNLYQYFPSGLFSNIFVGTGYSLYWFIVSVCLIYDLKRTK